MMKKSLVAIMCICVIDVMIASPEKIFTNHGMRQRWKKSITKLVKTAVKRGEYQPKYGMTKIKII